MRVVVPLSAYKFFYLFSFEDIRGRPPTTKNIAEGIETKEIEELDTTDSPYADSDSDMM